MNQPLKIAIADDHRMMRESLISMINDYEEFKVTIDAADGRELIKKLSNAKTLPDVCLLDISMRGMNGYDAMKEIRKNWPDLKVLAISMFDQAFVVVTILKFGARGFLSKNFDHPSEIKTALLSVHINGYYFSEYVDKKALKALNTNSKNAPRITDSEMTFLKYCCTNYEYRDIADLMNVSKRTVDGYRDSLLKKLALPSRTALCIFAINNGIVSLGDLSKGDDN